MTGEDVAFIRQFVAENVGDSRWSLSRKLCQAWDWRQPSGALRDMVCRGLMLQLDRAGQIELPPIRIRIVNPFLNRKKPPRIEIDQTPIEGTVSALAPLDFRQVRRTSSESLFNSLIEHYHYLGYCHPVGEQLKYIVFSKDRPIACLAWSSAPRHIGSRDRFIGWTKDIREKNLSLMACNTRFLILPWVQVSCLASHILGAMARILPKDWEDIYNHPLYYLETFVDQERFHGEGACYRAANWLCIGQTTGRGKNDQTGRPNRSLKGVWGYPLSKGFRYHLCGAHIVGMAPLAAKIYELEKLRCNPCGVVFTAEAPGDVNPFEYLTVLQKYSSEVFKNPRKWMPWNYQDGIPHNDS